MFEPVRKLQSSDDVDHFNCGQPALNQFLHRYALLSQKAGSVQTYVSNAQGRVLLKDALLRTLQAADIAGISAVLVHAKDEEARAWYASWDFEPSMTDPYHLFLLLNDLKVRP